MDSEETIEIGGIEHKIVVRPITLIVKGPTLTDDVKYKDRIPLDMTACLHHMDRTATFHKDVPFYIDKVFPHYAQKEVTPCSIRKEGLGMRHFAGRIDLSLKFIDMGVPFAWVYPEDGLHPASQAALGDVLVCLTKGLQPPKA
jgi:hypothetical protein